MAYTIGPVELARLMSMMPQGGVQGTDDNAQAQGSTVIRDYTQRAADGLSNIVHPLASVIASAVGAGRPVAPPHPSSVAKPQSMSSGVTPLDRRVAEIQRGFQQDRDRAATAASVQAKPATPINGTSATLPMDDAAAVASAQAAYDAAYRTGDPAKIQVAKDNLGQDRMNASQVRTYGFGGPKPLDPALQAQVDARAQAASNPAGSLGTQAEQDKWRRLGAARGAEEAARAESDKRFMDQVAAGPKSQADSYAQINKRRAEAGLPPLAAPDATRVAELKRSADDNRAAAAADTNARGKANAAQNDAARANVVQNSRANAIARRERMGLEPVKNAAVVGSGIMDGAPLAQPAPAPVAQIPPAPIPAPPPAPSPGQAAAPVANPVQAQVQGLSDVMSQYGVTPHLYSQPADQGGSPATAGPTGGVLSTAASGLGNVFAPYVSSLAANSQPTTPAIPDYTGPASMNLSQRPTPPDNITGGGGQDFMSAGSGEDYVGARPAAQAAPQSNVPVYDRKEEMRRYVMESMMYGPQVAAEMAQERQRQAAILAGDKYRIDATTGVQEKQMTVSQANADREFTRATGRDAADAAWRSQQAQLQAQNQAMEQQWRQSQANTAESRAKSEQIAARMQALTPMLQSPNPQIQALAARQYDELDRQLSSLQTPNSMGGVSIPGAQQAPAPQPGLMTAIYEQNQIANAPVTPTYGNYIASTGGFPGIERVVNPLQMPSQHQINVNDPAATRYTRGNEEAARYYKMVSEAAASDPSLSGPAGWFTGSHGDVGTEWANRAFHQLKSRTGAPDEAILYYISRAAQEPQWLTPEWKNVIIGNGIGQRGEWNGGFFGGTSGAKIN